MPFPLTKADQSNTTQYHAYDYQDNRVRSVVESNNQAFCRFIGV
jgi:hypothetical protein